MVKYESFRRQCEQKLAKDSVRGSGGKGGVIMTSRFLIWANRNEVPTQEPPGCVG